MEQRLRDMFHGAPNLSVPTPDDLSSTSRLGSWLVQCGFEGVDLVETGFVMSGLEPWKRRKLFDCRSREQMLDALDTLDQPSPCANMEVAVKAFLDHPLQSQVVLDRLWCKVQEDYRMWIDPSNKFVAPFFTIVQSSGWGKSRLAYELHRKGLYVIYVSCLDSKGTNYLAQYLCSKHMNALNMGAFLVASIRTLTEYLTPSARGHSSTDGAAADVKRAGTEMESNINHADGAGSNVGLFSNDTGGAAAETEISPANWMLDQLQPELPGSVTSKIFEKLETDVNVLKSTQGNSLRTYQRRSLQGDTLVYGAIEKALENAIEALPCEMQLEGVPSGSSLKVLFCFDEATALAESEVEGGWDTGFTLLTRLLSKAEAGLWALVLGTNSRLSNFAPSQAIDPTRKARVRGYKFFRPFWLTGSALPDDDPADAIDRSCFRFGRPLWRTYLARGFTERMLVDFATDKLNCDKENLTEAMVFSLMEYTVGLEVAEVSVAYHMMTVAWISEDTQRIQVSNAVEPVLASAAAGILCDQECLNKLLGLLAHMYKEGVVTNEPRGELVARLLVLLAMLQCLRDRGDLLYTGEVTLGEFLTKLLGAVPSGLVDSVDLDSKLRFNSFSPTYRRLSPALLDECYRYHRALTCKAGQRVVYSVLPTSGAPVGIQAKRWETDESLKMADAVLKLGGQFFQLGIIFQLGSPDPRSEQGQRHRGLRLLSEDLPFPVSGDG